MNEKPPQNQERMDRLSEIATEINEMVEVDQDMREKSLSDESHWDDSIDARNTARMKEIVREIGWPTISKVGTETSFNAWLLVQHADKDVSFQGECLELMRKEPAGEVDTKNIAMLEDRIRINNGQPQVYGTQYREIDGKHVPLEIEDLENVEERRKSMGLDTLEENTARIRGKYGTP